MADALFVDAKNAFLGAGTHGAIDLDGDNIKAVFVDHADDTPVVATDVDLADIAAAARVATSGNMTGASIASGAIDFADFTVSSVSGDQFESIVFYKDSGTAATSPLIVYIDGATGLPMTPSGSDIDVVFNASGLFAI